jgi:hypothetical protein
MRSTRLQAACWFFILLFVNQLFFPAVAVALTAGPSQPEVKSFEPVGTTEMVNLFSGDFTYNIPLLEVPGPDGGYPINLFYNSVTSMEQEATWTGLGWNINVGALSRSMRGLPDDFNGELVARKLDMRKNITATAGGTASLEIAGVDFSSSFSLGVNYVYNSYKGVGLSIDPAIGLGIVPGRGNYQVGLNGGLSLSTLDLASANVGFSLSYRGGRDYIPSVGANLSFDATGNERFSLNVNASKYTGRATNVGVSSNMSFSKAAYTPSIARKWKGFSVSFLGAFSPGGLTIHAKYGINGSYSEQSIADAKRSVKKTSFGYNYLQNNDKYGITDFNREKDGTLEKHKRYLATPIMTHDIYSITGQGIGGMFRAYRSDYGFLSDPLLESSTVGGHLGVEGGVLLKFGVDAKLNFRTEIQSDWPYISWVNYKGTDLAANYEPFYYKMAGEMTAEKANTYDYIGNGEARDKPMRLKIDKFNYNYYRHNGGELQAERDINTVSWQNQGRYDTKVQWNRDKNHRTIGNRKPRSSSVQPITNKLLMSGSQEILPEFDIKHYSSNSLNNYESSPVMDITRPNNDQNAAFTVVGQDGVRWNYGLPVYNHKQREANFSVAPDGNCNNQTTITGENDSRRDIDYKPSNSGLRSNDRIDEQELPQFVHSHLLTSVLGADYGDIDGIAGPSDGDVGYWMKTNYVKLSNNYQWRAPFFGANYARGFENDKADDVAALTWGEREVYLPATIETKTHIAYFEVSKRFDARGAKHYIQSNTDSDADKYGEYSYKLDKITLYAKSDIKANGKANATPLKTVHFQYDYSLCKGIDNNNPSDTSAINANQNLWTNGSNPAIKTGKLTLKSVYFTYENNTRGALSPYEFEYNSLNPDYDNSKIDKWGVYRSQNLRAGYDVCDNMNLPYTAQAPSEKARLDADIAAWHLKKIKTPSGAAINLVLERDDYGYVQDARATRMFKLSSLAEGSSGYNTFTVAPNPDYLGRTLQFELEQPTNDINELNNYIIDLPEVQRGNNRYKQLSYKIRVNLRNGNNGNDLWEYVSGYCEIEKNNNGRWIDFESTSQVGGEYTRANIVVKDSRINVQGKNYHPMLQNSWKFLKENLPQKMLEVDLGGAPDAIFQVSQLGENINAIFAGFYKYCANNEFGKTVDLERSYIRLNNPDRTQYGGGIRVKRIVMDDNWAATSSQTSTMGVAYDYTTTDGVGEAYSSGVLENEPSMGYEECALRWAVPQVERNLGGPIDVDWYEYPLNEGYYPGAEVGYSKVTVRSLASDYAFKKSKGETIPTDLQTTSYATTGQTVYEYYTAKDFPIVTNKTTLDPSTTDPLLSGLGELLVFTRIDQYTGTQGYSIEMNNMHGRERKISTYGQEPDGSVKDEPLTQVEYFYKSKERVDYRRGKPNQTIRVLDNEVKVLVADSPDAEAAQTEKQLMGVDYEFFIDGRQAVQTAFSVGAQVNQHIVFIPTFFPIIPFIPIPVTTVIPSYSFNENKSRTSVSNKVIVRSGILEEVYAFDGQAHLVTTNKVFDPKTGQPLLSTVDNQLTGKIYNYSVPAYLAHEGMGAAAENWGHRLEFIFDRDPDACTGYFPTTLTNEQLQNLSAGDEFVAELKLTSGSNATLAKARIIYMGELYTQAGNKQPQFDILNYNSLNLTNQVNNFQAVCTNTRSGKRNLIGASIAQYSTIDTEGNTGGANPLTNRTMQSAATSTAMEISLNNGVANLSPTNATSVEQVTIDNVLSTSGAVFSDDWALEYYNYKVNTDNINPYISGKRGVWKSKSTHAYIDARTQQPLAAQPKLADIRTSGVLNAVSLFNWENPFVQYVEGSKWVRTQDISKYRLGGQAVESRDVLGNYQAALYGYGDNLVTAQAANAKYYEVGFEGFEEWNQGDQTLDYLGNKGYINNGNIDILPGQPNSYREQHEHYRLTYPMLKPSNDTALVLVKKPYVAHPINIDKASLYLSDNTDKVRVEAQVVQAYPLDAGNNRYKVPGLTNLIDTDTEGEYMVLKLDFSAACNKEALEASDWWAGEITLLHKRPVSEQAAVKSIVKVVQDYAHTGEYSLLVPPDEAKTGHKLEQQLLYLQDGKNYVFSAWVRVQNNAYPVEDNAVMSYGQYGSYLNINGKTLGPAGPIIEGWQKVEGTFTYDNIGSNPDNVFQIIAYPGNNYMYLDDIRIFPADGNMVSHVYNPVDFKLRATLDDNNYATFYIYDEAGNLISTKRETERGIKTIQEARNYIQPNQ